MALAVDVRFESRKWRAAWPRAATETRQLVRAAYEIVGEGGAASQEVAVLLADDERLHELNLRFRGKDRATNVLSFENPQAPFGGIALAFETVFREAEAQKKLFVNHSKHLIVHGFLHLIGYDHAAPKARRLMEGREIAILKAMGIPNPYVIGTKTRA